MINFEDARVLTFNSENRFFGDIFRYSNLSNLTVQGSLYNLTNQSGVSGIWSGIRGKVSSANDYDDVQIGGVSFGKGRIDNLRFLEGNDVRKKDYQVALTVFNSGNLYNLGGASYYQNIDTSKFHLIDNFSESISINIDQNNDYTYEQTVSCRFISNGSGVNTIPIAKKLAADLFSNTSGFGYFTNQYGHFFNESGKRLHRETYNLITNECSFTVSYRQPANTSGDYSAKYDYTITTDEKGVTTVQEHGVIEGINDPIDVSAENRYQNSIGSSYTRANSEFGFYAPNGAYPLNQTCLTLSKKVNVYEGLIEYTVTYNNDPALMTSQTYSWEYTQEIRKENCVNTISENGKVRGLSTQCTYADRYANADAGYATVIAQISSRVTAFASSLNVSATLRQTQATEERSQFQGEISYRRVYTDQLASTATANIKKIETEIVDVLPVALVNKFIAFGFGGKQGKEVIQDAKIPTPGQRNVSIKVFGYRPTPKSQLMSAAKTTLNNNIPVGTDPYASSVGYVYEPTTNVLSARVSWTVFNNWSFTDTTLA